MHACTIHPANICWFSPQVYIGWPDYIDGHTDMVCLVSGGGHGVSSADNYSYLCTAKQNKGLLGSLSSKMTLPRVHNLTATAFGSQQVVPLGALVGDYKEMEV